MTEPQYVIAMPDSLPKGLCIISIDALTMLREQAGWISVKDQLPEKRQQRVLTWSSYRIEIKTMKSCIWDAWVTHWMPLPEPPAQEND